MGLRNVDERRLRKMLKRRKTWTKLDEKNLKKRKKKFGKKRYLYFRLMLSDNSSVLQAHPEGRRFLNIRIRERLKGKLKKVM